MKLNIHLAVGAALIAILPHSPLFAQDGPPPTVAEAPPIGAPAAPAVYNWRDVPANTPVVIDRAVFDPGGYQLYCQTGETIVVPFENQNLYIMRFGRSEDGATHFVNDGVAPMLLIPPGGYLENAAAQGARWYPFPRDYVYTGPVYMGVAPSYHEYVDMGWYPGMVYYGGYWGYHPYRAGIVFSPLPGLYFSIYDHPYYGWNEYHSYYYAHPEHRYYERTVVVYHYNDYRPRGVAYYHAHPEHSFAVEHHAAAIRVAEHHAAEVHHAEDVHHAEAVHRVDDHHPAGGAFGAAKPAGGSFGGARPADHAFGTTRPAGGAFGGSKPTSGLFGGDHPAPTGTFGGARPSTTGSFGGARPTPTSSFGGAGPTTGSFGGAKATTQGSFGSHNDSPGTSSFGGYHPSPSGTSSFGGSRPAPSGTSSFGGSHTSTMSTSSPTASRPGGSFGSGTSRSVVPAPNRSIQSGSKSTPAKATPAPKKG